MTRALVNITTSIGSNTAWQDAKSVEGRRRAPRSGLYGGRHLRHKLIDRFWARVDKRGPNDCWLFAGYPAHAAGHAHIVRDDGTRVYAHRLAWELAYGPIPEGQRVLHSCDVPLCVNPKHLSLGTQRDNILDSICKGRYNAFGKQKLNADQVRAIRWLVAAGHRQKDVAVQFGIRRHSVSGIVNRKSWAHLS